MSTHIFLIGLMGSGKTTVGRKLATLLGREFIDTDQELIRRTGVSISHIFEVEGEDGFRDRESRLLADICERDSAVISTGGGIVLREQNRDLMTQNGTVVFLDIPIGILWNRLKDCQNRPLLQVADPRSRVEQLKTDRDPVYAQACDLIIPVASDSALRTAKRIQENLNKMQSTQQQKSSG